MSRAARLTARWTRLSLDNAPLARSSHGLSSIGGAAYLFGGEATARTAIDSVVHRLDLQAGAWTELEPSGSAAPLPRIGHAQCAASGQLIVFGGRTSVSMGEGDLNDLWSFDPEAVAWTPLEAASGEPPSARSFHRAAAVGDRVYVFGGCDASGRRADLHEFDLSSRRWTELAPPADLGGYPGRGGATLEAAADGSALLAVAGFAGHETNDVVRFDVARRVWERAPSEWLRPRSVCASFSFAPVSGPAVVVFGGEVSPSDKGHEGAGGFASDLVGIDAGGQPIEVVVDGASTPPPRGWGAGTAIAADQGVLFGGLSGDDAAPVRLGDAWHLEVA